MRRKLIDKRSERVEDSASDSRCVLEKAVSRALTYRMITAALHASLQERREPLGFGTLS